jgi:putative addiction module component (TIGR02574 family)
MIHPNDFPYHELSIEERLVLVEGIWDSIATEQEKILLTDVQRAELDRRLAEHHANPSAAVSWEEVKAYVRTRIRERHKKSA